MMSEVVAGCVFMCLGDLVADCAGRVVLVKVRAILHLEVIMRQWTAAIARCVIRYVNQLWNLWQVAHVVLILRGSIMGCRTCATVVGI